MRDIPVWLAWRAYQRVHILVLNVSRSEYTPVIESDRSLLALPSSRATSFLSGACESDLPLVHVISHSNTVPGAVPVVWPGGLSGPPGQTRGRPFFIQIPYKYPTASVRQILIPGGVSDSESSD